MKTKYLKIRCFLEGYEVPVISASVSAVMNDIARASIEIIATPEALRLRPKTLVTVYYLDDVKLTNEESADDVNDKYYKLFFLGELASVSLSKSSAGRSVVLSCTDAMENLSRAYSYFLGKDATIANFMAAQGLFAGASVKYNMVDNAEISLMVDAFKDPTPQSAEFTNYKGLLGALVKVIELYTGITRQDTAAINPFFQKQQERLNLLGQIGIYSNDAEAIALFDSNVLTNFIYRTYGIQGGLMKVSDLISMIIGLIGYTRSPNPIPFGIGASVTDDREFSDIVVNSGQAVNNQGSSTSTVKQLITNVFGTKSEVQKFKDAENLVKLRKSSEDSNVPSTTSTLLENSVKTLDTNQQDVMFQKLRAVATLADAEDLEAEPSEELKRALSDLGTKVKTENIQSSTLFTTVIMPDTFYADPPKCNVLFPSMYTSLSYNRDMSSEISRLQLVTNYSKAVAQPTEMVYYAPSISILQQIQGKYITGDAYNSILESKGNDKSTASILMDHELFTGVVPEFTTMSRLEFMIAQGEKLKGEGSSADGITKISEFFTTYADAMFLQRRLSSRSLSCNGPFNPNAVVGFPMYVIDQPSKSSREQFQGVLQSITHTINQTGGNTTYNIIYARQIGLKDDEFFNNIPEDGDIRNSLFPKWLNDAYKPDQISTVYKELLGVESLYAEKVDSKINSLLKAYTAVANKGDSVASEWSWSYVKRPIVNMVSVKQFLKSKTVEIATISSITEVCPDGATSSPSTHTVNVPKDNFDPATSRKSAVIAYLTSIKDRSLLL